MTIKGFDGADWTFNSGDSHHDLNFYGDGDRRRIVSFADDSLGYYKVEGGSVVLIWKYVP